jgi:hypothetical protein
VSKGKTGFASITGGRGQFGAMQADAVGIREFFMGLTLRRETAISIRHVLDYLTGRQKQGVQTCIAFW